MRLTTTASCAYYRYPQQPSVEVCVRPIVTTSNWTTKREWLAQRLAEMRARVASPPPPEAGE